MKLKKKLAFVLFLILLISISGCKGKKDVRKALDEIRTGTEGIVMSFLANAPPSRIIVEQGIDNPPFDVILELKNKGAYPQPENAITAPPGKVYLSGYDKNIISFDKNSLEDLSGKPLEGKSTINPIGGFDFLTFKGTVNIENLIVEKYEPTLQAIVCYQYWTIAGPSVCIDPDPYSTITEKKVCNVQSISLSSQGAPIAVTKIEEDALATKTQFRITIKNVGSGEVFKDSSLEKCSPFGEKVGREDIDKVYVNFVKVGNKELACRPFIDRADQFVKGASGYVRLINGEGTIICELPGSDYASTKSAYTTPINIYLQYAYRNTIEKKLLIKMEGGGLGDSYTPTAPDKSRYEPTAEDAKAGP